MPIDFTQRRKANQDLKNQYKTGVEQMFAEVGADWQQLWAEDCRDRGITASYADWVMTPNEKCEGGESPFECGAPITVDHDGNISSW
jgi:hypothetical protein